MDVTMRVGTVTAVNRSKRLARVKFQDLGYTSAWLKVLGHEPRGSDGAVLHQTETQAGGSGEASFAGHSHGIVVRPWMPEINDTVLCAYLPASNGDGFILGWC